MENQPNKLGVSLFEDSHLVRMVKEAEEDINATTKKRHIIEKISSYQDSLDEYFFQTQASRTKRLVGMAALIPVIDDFSETAQAVAYYPDITVRGFEIHRTDLYHAFLRFDIPAPVQQSQAYYLPEESESYYIHPSNIISTFDSHEEIRTELQQTLVANAVSCKNQLVDFPFLPPEQKNYVLHRLAESAGEPFMRRYSGKDVSIEAQSFYDVEFDSQGPFIRNNISVPNPEVKMVHKYPYGTVSTCLFIEQALFQYDTNKKRFSEPLMLSEPCIVLELDGIPRYLVPISQVRDVLEM